MSQIKCLYCGREIREGTTFCIYCGKKIYLTKEINEQAELTNLLKNYKDLFDAGIITKDEYESKKSFLLDRIEKNEAILNPNEAEKKQNYLKAIEYENDNRFEEAKELFEKNINFLDSKSHFENCEKQLKEPEYQKALNLFDNKDFESALVLFENLIDYKETDSLILQCKKAIRTKEEKNLNENTYCEALQFENNQRYEEAIALFQSIIDYKDSEKHISICKNALALKTEELNESRYQQALLYEKSGNYESALIILGQLDDYKDSSEHIEICKKGIEAKEIENKYNSAQIKLTDNPPLFKVNKAISNLETIKDYKDSEALIRKYNEYINLHKQKHQKKKKIVTIASIAAGAVAITGITIGIIVGSVVNNEKKQKEQYNLICDTIDAENFKSAYNMCENYHGNNRNYLITLATAGISLTNNNYENAIEILCSIYVDTYVTYNANGGTMQKQTDHFNHESKKTNNNVYVYNPCSYTNHSFSRWQVRNISFESHERKVNFTLRATWDS